MNASLVYQSLGGGSSWLNQGNNWVQTIYGMVEARNHFRLDYTSILYTYTVFKDLPMQLMVIWIHPYFIKAMEVD